MSKTSDLSGHYVIGIVATSFHSDFSRMIVTRICDRFKGEDVEIHLYLGVDASRYLMDYYDADDGMELHYFSLFTYSNFDDIDLLIVSGEAIYTETKGVIPGMDEVLSKLPDIPTIIISSNEGTGAIHICVDNYDSLKEVIRHLHSEHGCQKIAYFSGNPVIPDAAERLRAYKDCMSEIGLGFDENLVAYGNFTANCDAELEKFFVDGSAPDAIVCANDEMAAGAYRVAKSHGLRVGRDIYITGFDDISIAAAMDPPLTTVRQDFDELARKVGEVAYDYLAGREQHDYTVAAVPVYRASCGCSFKEDRVDEAEVDEKGAFLFGEYQDLKMGRISQMKGALLLRSLLMQPITIKSFFRKLGENIVRMGVRNSWITIFDKPIVVPPEERIFKPESTRLVLITNEDRIHAYDIEEASILMPDRGAEEISARRHIHHESDGVWSTYLLFYGNVQYGAWTVKLKLSDVIFFYSLSLEIGSAMRYLYLALDQQEAHKKLEKQNRMLDYSATHDALTGLFNRGGTVRYLEYFVNQSSADKFVAVMADLDHLKQINDRFGHDAGDYAIKRCGQILTEALDGESFVGRTGGDEFVTIFSVTERLSAEEYKKRVKEICKKENDTNGKPFYVEISVGCYETDKNGVSDVSKTLNEADARLYEAKKNRRENVIRG